MKTILITLEYPPYKGGVANYYGNLSKYWPDRSQWRVLDNSTGRLLDKKYPWPWLGAYFSLRQELKREPDATVLVGQILPLGTAAWLLSLSRPVRYDVFLHGMDFTFAHKSPRKAKLAAKILARANKVICANSYVAKLVEEKYPSLKERIIIVNPGISDNTASRVENLEAQLRDKFQAGRRVILLSLGRLVRRKGVDTTLEALARLDDETRRGLRYIVAGTGPEEKALRDEAAQKGLSDTVYFAGEVGEAEKWSLLSLCDIFIMPSRDIDGDFEGFGIVYLEANLYGKPVIAARSGGVPDAVEANVSGLLVEPDDPEALAAAIKKLAGNPEWRQVLGRQGRERALRQFDWEKQVAYLAKNI